VAVEGLSTCNPTVRMQHHSACSKFSMFNTVNWIENKGWWASGLVLLVVSIFIGVLGGKLFSPVICVLGALVVFATIFVSASLFQLNTTKVSFGVSIGVGIVLGGLTALLVHRTKKI